MTALVVVGTQWGDEGKGKIVDVLAAQADVVARYAGGPNAGHTLVVNGQKLVVRLVPSGILHPDTRCVLGQGMVVDPWSLVDELASLDDRGIEWRGRVILSSRAHLILPHHRLADGLREEHANPGRAIGTTKRGIGPCYEDKVARRGLHAGMLRDLSRASELLTETLQAWRPVFESYGQPLPSVQEVIEQLGRAAQVLVPLLGNASEQVSDAIRGGSRVLLEGAQGTLLDIDHGTYPFVTSSTAVAGGACAGIGIGPTRLDHVVGVVKAYTTRVGEGPFPTELHDEVGEHMQRVGHEFGSVTGRARRAGWLDLPALRHAVRVNGLDSFVLTKLDVLSGLDELHVCVAYETDEHKRWEQLPDAWFENPAIVKPAYETLRGWSEPLDKIRRIEDLPQAARDYVKFIEDGLGVPCAQVSVGPGRAQLTEAASLWG